MNRCSVRGVARAVYVAIAVVVVVVAALGYYYVAYVAPAPVKPIKVGYVGDVGSVGTRPCIETVRLAAEEINEAGGILGRPVEVVVGQGKGETTTSVSEAKRLIMEEGVLLLMVEGRSEIALAVMDASAELFPDYPHIFVVNWAMAHEIALKIYKDPQKYGHCFQGGPHELHYYGTFKILADEWKAMNVTKVAILWEGLAWTAAWRPLELGGKKVLGFEWVPDVATFLKDYVGIDVVYQKVTSPKEPNYYPILEAIKNAGAELIFYVSSWFTNVDTFVSQWATSAARDIYVQLFGGAGAYRGFWTMTLYKCLGVLAPFLGPLPEEVPDGWPKDRWLPFYEKCMAKGIEISGNSMTAYGHVYQLKKAVEKVGDTKDIKALIKAFEETEVLTPTGKFAFVKDYIYPFWHTSAAINIYNDSRLFEPAVGWGAPTNAQWQYDPAKKAPKIVYLADVYKHSWDTPEALRPAIPSPAKTPAELRHMAGWPGY
ncbi:MAG: ABC transporter substrate-binding protein [Candidatus Bathyarchaeia archaeon]